MKLLEKIISHLNTVVKALLITAFTAMVIITFTQIIFRYVLTKPIPWAEELARYLFVWITYLGASVATKNRAHVGVEIIVSLFPHKIQKIMLSFAYLSSAIFVLLMTYHGWELVQRTTRQLSPAMRMPMKYASVAIPIGCALMFLNFIYIMLEELSQFKKSPEDILVEKVGGE